MEVIYKENSPTSGNEGNLFMASGIDGLEISNYYKSPSERIQFLKVGSQGCEKSLSLCKHWNFPFERLSTFLKEAFLPVGYPESVSDDYIPYQIWDTIQAFASSISGSLATQAVLEGVGVGDANATSLAATITWLLRQGTGMMGQIVFTWVQGSDLDHNCKRWRLFADVLNDSAMCLELSGPLWPSFILQFILCFASLARSLVGVAGGATRMAVTQHQARSGNISDVAAKDGSQETLVNLVALVINLIVLPLVSGNSALIWTLFSCLTVLHLYANFKAVSSLCFDTLNKDRLIMVLQSYDTSYGQKVESPKTINGAESVFLGCGLDEGVIRINLGVSFQTVLNVDGSNMTMGDNTIKQIQIELSSRNFAIVPRFCRQKNVTEYNVLLNKGFTARDILTAYFVAYKTASALPLKEDTIDNWDDVRIWHEKEFVDFENKLIEAGWKTQHVQLNTIGWTGNFIQCETKT